MTLSTLSVVPEATASGTALCTEHPHAVVPPWYARSTDIRLQAVARAARPDYPAWLSHVKTAAACTRPVRLAGTMATVEAATGRILAERATADLPDGVIYKPCGNRRESVCPACSERYKRDAYQVVRSGLVGGKGVPEQVAHHPAVFPTLTAPSFGEVHTRVVNRHTCSKRTDCDCRPEPCHARRDLTVCPHGARLACYARHDRTDPRLGTPLCLDCYDYPGQVVWNLMAGELWRRTTIAINRYLRRLARERGLADIPVLYTSKGKACVRRVTPFRLSFGKAAEMQRRAAVHYHAIIRLDGFDHTSNRLTDDPINLFADGTHPERLIEACWMLGRPREWRRLRRWAHMLGFGGHFLTKSRRYSITFALLRNQRIVFRRNQTAGPEHDAADTGEPTTLVVNFLQFVGAGWQTPADAMLANTSAAMAREHQRAAAEYLSTVAA